MKSPLSAVLAEVSVHPNEGRASGSADVEAPAVLAAARNRNGLAERRDYHFRKIAIDLALIVGRRQQRHFVDAGVGQSLDALFDFRR